MTAVPTKNRIASKAGPRLVDEFDAYDKVFRDVKLWRAIALAMGVLALVMMLLVVAKSFQPPVVIVKDRTTSEKPDVVKGGLPPELTAIDAENFFIYALRLRYGWESLTILRDFNEIHDLMTTELGTAFAAYVNQRVKVGKDGPEKPRVFTWMDSRVHNSVSLDRKAIVCDKGEPVKGVPQWYCRGFGFIEMQPLEGNLPETAQVRVRQEFRARFQPAPYDEHNVFGFVIAYLDAVDPEETK
jgi:hypothetical protein